MHTLQFSCCGQMMKSIGPGDYRSCWVSSTASFGELGNKPEPNDHTGGSPKEISNVDWKDITEYVSMGRIWNGGWGVHRSCGRVVWECIERAHHLFIENVTSLFHVSTLCFRYIAKAILHIAGNFHEGEKWHALQLHKYFAGLNFVDAL